MKLLKFCGETGIRTPATVTRRQISNLLHYHSGTSPKVFKFKFFYMFLVSFLTKSFLLKKTLPTTLKLV